MTTVAPFTTREDTEAVPLQLSRSGSTRTYWRHPGVAPRKETVHGQKVLMEGLHQQNCCGNTVSEPKGDAVAAADGVAVADAVIEFVGVTAAVQS